MKYSLFTKNPKYRNNQSYSECCKWESECCCQNVNCYPDFSKNNSRNRNIESRDNKKNDNKKNDEKNIDKQKENKKNDEKNNDNKTVNKNINTQNVEVSPIINVNPKIYILLTPELIEAVRNAPSGQAIVLDYDKLNDSIKVE